MHTINEFKENFNQAISQFESLLSIAHDEEKELGKPKDDTIRLFNALYFQLEESYSCISNGLDGKFPFESKQF